MFYLPPPYSFCLIAIKIILEIVSSVALTPVFGSISSTLRHHAVSTGQWASANRSIKVDYLLVIVIFIFIAAVCKLLF